MNVVEVVDDYIADDDSDEDEDVDDIDDAAYIAAGLEAGLNEEDISQERTRLLISLVYEGVLNSHPKED